LDPIEGQQPQNQEGGAHNQGADAMSQPAAGYSSTLELMQPSLLF